MPMTRSQPPSEADEAVRAGMRHLADTPGSVLHGLRAAPAERSELTPTSPHQVHTLGLSDLVAPGRRLAAARLTGWRYLLRRDDRVVAAAETVADPGGQARFSHVNDGPFVASTAAALDLAEQLPETQSASFEALLLHIPALYTMALWLHADGGNDLLIPLDPAPAGIEVNRAYPADELLDLLAERGRQIPQLAPDDTRGG